MLALDAGSLADLRMPVRSVTGPVTTSAILMCASAPAALRDANGIGNSVIRWSIGLEDAGGLIADLDQALAVIS